MTVTIADDKGTENTVGRKWNVARTKNEQGQVAAWNFFHISDHLTTEGNGQVSLADEELAKLDRLIKEAGSEGQFEADHELKIVVGHVETRVLHPDFDHLSTTETKVDNGAVLQIVCDTPNIEAGQEVVVAKPEAMMPDGMMTWPEILRGIVSYGMICPTHKLHLPNASEKKGTLVLPEDAVVGEVFPK